MVESPQLSILEILMLVGSVVVAGTGPLLLHGDEWELLTPAAAACKYFNTPIKN